MTNTKTSLVTTFQIKSKKYKSHITDLNISVQYCFHHIPKTAGSSLQLRLAHREYIGQLPKGSTLVVYPLYGDRLETLANRYYGDTSLWWIIAKANEIGKGKIGVDPEKKLRIPTKIGDIIALVENNS